MLKMTNDTMIVTDYRRLMTNMLDDLKLVRSYAGDLHLEEVKVHAEQTINRIENTFFTVAVVGEFKRGKSTLINALLGQEILPADVLPCSATLNRVTYGPTPSARIFFKAKDGQPERVEDVAVEKLTDYVTKLTPESETRASDIKEAVVYYPTPYCRDKADIVDTPGLNDDENMTQVTLSVLPTTDAAIMLILAQAPFAGTEGDFLNNRMLTSDMGRVMFVVNRIDQIDEDEREKVYMHVSKRIRQSVEQRAAELYGRDTEEYRMFVKKIGEPKVFGVSAKQALKAKLNNDISLMERSGFTKFENALERFLTQERGNVTLQVLADCTVSSTSKILHKVTLQEGALQMKEQEFEVAYRDATGQLETLRRKYDEEINKIKSAAEKAYAKAQAVLSSLEGEIKQTAEKTIAAASLEANDIDEGSLPQTQVKLGKSIADAIQGTVHLIGDKAQVEIERELRKEINRLQELASEVKSVMGQIQFGFEQVRIEATGVSSTTADVAMGSVVGAMTSWMLPVGGLFTGYREAGAGGAVVGGFAGAGAGLAALFGGGLVIGILGLPLTWPVMIPVLVASGIASAFGGKWAAHAVFGGNQVSAFKEKFKQAVFDKMRQQMYDMNADFRQQLRGQIDQTFDALKNHVHLELGSQIEQTQKTLDDLRGKQSRSEAEREMELKMLAEIRLETQMVQSKALAKSNELREITSV